jgi:hypothetical protein
MEIYTRLYELLEDTARRRSVAHLCIGLGYTVVVLDNGDSGVAFSWVETKGSCTLFKDPVDYEGKSASLILKK